MGPLEISEASPAAMPPGQPEGRFKSSPASDRGGGHHKRGGERAGRFESAGGPGGQLLAWGWQLQA